MPLVHMLFQLQNRLSKRAKITMRVYKSVCHFLFYVNNANTQSKKKLNTDPKTASSKSGNIIATTSHIRAVSSYKFKLYTVSHRYSPGGFKIQRIKKEGVFRDFETNGVFLAILETYGVF